ncbi:MAG: hypothetical protein IT464_09775 [Planctomycetes bacterium]|nr:hypothetical protein [Planctomycetota bacterium]
MRCLCLLLILCAPALWAETPAGSFHSFIAAVLDTNTPEAERRLIFERYFDFDTWMAAKQVEDGKEYPEAERAQLKQEWFTVFLSAEFRQRFAARNVQVIEEPEPQDDKAELVIKILEPAAAAGRYRVLMTRNGEYWRWYSIPRIEEEPTPETPLTAEEKLAAIQQAIADARVEQEKLAARLRNLDAQRKVLEAEIAEKNAGAAPYSTPMTTARTLGKAVLAADADALLKAHTPARRNTDRKKLGEKLNVQAERVAGWEPLDVTLSENNTQAVVRVKLKLWDDTGVKERTISLLLRKVDAEWLVDEAP